LVQRGRTTHTIDAGGNTRGSAVMEGCKRLRVSQGNTRLGPNGRPQETGDDIYLGKLRRRGARGPTQRHSSRGVVRPILGM